MAALTAAPRRPRSGRRRVILDHLFFKHPREQDETYAEHARFAAGVGSRMVASGVACLIHAVLPAVFTTTGSRTVAALARRLADRNARS